MPSSVEPEIARISSKRRPSRQRRRRSSDAEIEMRFVGRFACRVFCRLRLFDREPRGTRAVGLEVLELVLGEHRVDAFFDFGELAPLLAGDERDGPALFFRRESTG